MKTKKIIYYFLLLLNILGLSYYVYRFHLYEEKAGKKSFHEEVEYAGILWPVGTEYETDTKGDIILTSKYNLEAFNGIFPSESQFKLFENKIESIKTKGTFFFAGIRFEAPGKIYQFFEGEDVHNKIEFTKKVKIDGLELDPGCHIKLQNFVLYSAYCEKFGEVKFKRFVTLPIVELIAD